MKARFLSLNWLEKDGASFSEITPIVRGRAEKFYKSEFMTYLLEEFWHRE